MMSLSVQMEQYLVRHGAVPVDRLARTLRISPDRCLDELAGLGCYGIEVDEEGVVQVPLERAGRTQRASRN